MKNRKTKQQMLSDLQRNFFLLNIDLFHSPEKTPINLTKDEKMKLFNTCESLIEILKIDCYKEENYVQK